MASWSISPDCWDLHVAERAEVDLAEQGVGFDVVGVLVDLLLCGGDGFADAAELEVEVGEAILEEGGVGVGVEGELVLLDGLGGVVGAAGAGGHVLIEVGEAVVVVGGGAIGILGGRGDGMH